MIYEKLAQIQDLLFVPKDQRNDFGKYNYRTCEDILKAIKPIIKDAGCVLMITNELINVGNRNYVEATVVLRELETGEELISKAQAREEEEKKGMDGSQITGASSSYARKYALAGLFCIDNEKDSDATNEQKKDEEAYPSRAKMLECARKHYPDGSEQLKALLDTWKVSSLEYATNARLKDIWDKYGNKGTN